MSERIILCSGCGAKNRLGEGKGTPRCGKCQKMLNVPSQGAPAGGSIQDFFSSPLVIGGGIVLAIMIFANMNDSPPKRTSYSSAAITEEPPAPVFNHPPVPIQHGVVDYPERQGVAPLAIKTRPGMNYYVKLVNRVTQQETMSMYVQGGVPLEVEVPLGEYELRYAAGDTWYGKEYNFGPGDMTSYSKADSVFNFTREYDGYSGYTVELILQRHGNLSTRKINPNDF